MEINTAFAEEVIEKYGHRKAFRGWYISHEIDVYRPDIIEFYQQIATHLKRLKNVPILISPFIRGKKQFSEDPTTLDQHRSDWDHTFEVIHNCIDIVAFQDGHVDFDELPAYLEVNREIADKYDLKCWSNIEVFSRDMPIKFLPIGWPELLWKIEVAEKKC